MRFSHDGFLLAIDGLVYQIDSEEYWKPDYIVAITKGGLVPGTYLSGKLGIPMTTVDWSTNESALGNESVTWIPEDINCGKRVLIVTDVVDTGETVRTLIEDWQKCIRQTLVHSNIRVASLCYNYESPFSIDYHHFHTESGGIYKFEWDV